MSTSDPSSTTMARQKDTLSVLVNAFNEFNYFPKLPVELRLAIWKFVCHQPRYVKLRIEIFSPGLTIDEIDSAESSKDPGAKYPWRFRSPNGLPSILYASQEAHEVGLTYYNAAFTTWAWAARHPPFSTYMNWDIDTISPILPKTIPRPLCLRNVSSILYYNIARNEPTLRKLAIDKHMAGQGFYVSEMLEDNLHNLIMYHDDDASHCSNNGGKSITTKVRPYDPSRAICITNENEVDFFKLVEMQDSISNWTGLFEMVKIFDAIIHRVALIESRNRVWEQTYPLFAAWKRPNVKLMLMLKNSAEEGSTKEDLGSGNGGGEEN